MFLKFYRKSYQDHIYFLQRKRTNAAPVYSLNTFKKIIMIFKCAWIKNFICKFITRHFILQVYDVFICIPIQLILQVYDVFIYIPIIYNICQYFKLYDVSSSQCLMFCVVFVISSSSSNSDSSEEDALSSCSLQVLDEDSSEKIILIHKYMYL